jgi:carboxylate-amine ligase
VETHVSINKLLEFVDDVVDELGSREHINYVHQILKNGTGAAKQLAVFKETNDLTKVVDFITSEFTKGL